MRTQTQLGDTELVTSKHKKAGAIQTTPKTGNAKKEQEMVEIRMKSDRQKSVKDTFIK